MMRPLYLSSLLLGTTLAYATTIPGAYIVEFADGHVRVLIPKRPRPLLTRNQHRAKRPSTTALASAD